MVLMGSEVTGHAHCVPPSPSAQKLPRRKAVTSTAPPCLPTATERHIISLVSSLQHWSIGPVSFLLFWTISFYNRQSHSAKRVCLPARRHAAPRTASPHFHPESLFPTCLPTFQPAHLSEPHIHPIQKTPERTARLCTQMSLPEKTMGPHFCASFLVVYDTQV